MLDPFINVPLPDEHATPHARLVLHDRVDKHGEPFTFVIPFFGEEDQIPADWVLEQSMFRDVRAQRTRGITIRELLRLQRPMDCFHLSEETSELERTHDWKIHVRTERGFAENVWPAKPSPAELDAWFTEVRAEKDQRGKNFPYHRLHLVSRRPWSIDPISYAFLAGIAEMETRTTLHKAYPHPHNTLQGDRFLSVVGERDTSSTKDGAKTVFVEAFTAQAVVIVDVEANALLLLDLNLFQVIKCGRRAILDATWWHEWRKANSAPSAS